MGRFSRRSLLLGGGAAVTALGVEGCNLFGGAVNGPLSGGYTLIPKYADHVYGGKTLRTRTYNGQIPGPTMYTQPGATLSVTINNQLPPNPSAPIPSSARVFPSADMESMGRMPMGRSVLATNIDPMNNPHLFNTTNLHVHGLQTIPHMFEPVGTSNPAAMFVAIDPGTSYTYNFQIPPDQPSGLYWYHPHHHGSTDVEISGGMAGLIIVKGPIDAVPEIAAARDIPIAIQSLQVDADPKLPGIYDTEYIAYQPPASGGYSPRSQYIFLLVNGQLVNLMSSLILEQPNSITSQAFAPMQLVMNPGEVVRLRILNGTNALNLPLQLPGFEVYVIGYDGVNVLQPQQMDQTGGNNIFVPSGARLELLVRAPQTPGSYTLSALAITNQVHPWPQFDLVQIAVAGNPVTMGIPATLPTPTREYPLIADSELVGSRSVAFAASASTSILAGTALTVNTKSYDEMSVMFNLTLGAAEEWTITNNMAEGHPFHLHTNSFEVRSSTSAAGTTTYNPPYIADTVWVPANGKTVIRVRYKQWKGKDVFHCHKITHEDQGMMANIMFQ
jgi:suppressor of ftsI